MFDKWLVELDEKYKKLQFKIDNLNSNANMLYQNRLANNIEISGIPYTTNESLIDILSCLANNLNINLNAVDVINIYRNKVSKDRSNRIIVYFNNKNIKQE